MNRDPLQQYEVLYAKRRSIPSEWVRENERLQLAAFLEWEMIVGNLTCYQARKKYVAQYPESNRLAVSLTKRTWFGYVTEDKEYAKGSVLEMIKPYDQTERSLTD
jgi:hypothetical protein